MAYGYITQLSENVECKHVRYNNRYGIAIAADVYAPKSIDKSKKYPALIVGAPYGGVKEQGPCVYANELAQRGFIVLTFDQVYMGESGGEPRHVSSPDLFAESFSAAVDYLGVKEPNVDREKIGVIGICGSGGFALSAAQVDTRIKAVATTSMYVMVVFATPLYYYGMTAQLKTVVDRFCAYNSSLNRRHLKSALLTVAWNADDWTFEALTAHYKTLVRYINFADQGMILGYGCGTPAMTKRSRYPKQAYELGKNLK